MNIYRIQEDGTVTGINGLRNRFPHIGFSEYPDNEFLSFHGIDIVERTPPPQVNKFERAVEATAEFINGTWQLTWAVTPWPQEEISRYLSLSRLQVWERIKQYRDSLESTAGVKVGSFWFHSDDKSLIKYLGLKDKARDILTAGGTMDSPIMELGVQVQWSSLSNTLVPMTCQLAFSIVDAVGDLQAQLFKRGLEHKAMMEASTDPEMYDYQTGWPPTYKSTIEAVAKPV